MVIWALLQVSPIFISWSICALKALDHKKGKPLNATRCQWQGQVGQGNCFFVRIILWFVNRAVRGTFFISHKTLDCFHSIKLLLPRSQFHRESFFVAKAEQYAKSVGCEIQQECKVKYIAHQRSIQLFFPSMESTRSVAKSALFHCNGSVLANWIKWLVTTFQPKKAMQLKIARPPTHAIILCRPQRVSAPQIP